MSKKKSKWIQLSPKDWDQVSSGTDLDLYHYQKFGISKEVLTQAKYEYDEVYSHSAYFAARHAQIHKTKLTDAQEKAIAAKALGTGMQWHCFWTGSRIIWRLDHIYAASQGDPRLRYIRRNSSQMRYVRRAVSR